MNTPAALVVAAVVLAVPSAALAQDGTAPVPSAAPAPGPTAVAPSPAPATVPSPAAAPPAGAPGSPLTTCALGDHAGFDDADAETTRRLVCDEIARTGAPPGARYHVNLGKLGKVVILSVSREGATPGAIADSRELRLSSIEEVSVAGPRLADALVHGQPIKETETTENLVGEETRETKEAPGKLHFAVGLMGLMPPFDRGMSLAAGGLIDLHYEAARVELVGGMRGGGNSSDSDPSMSYFMIPIGGRYHFTDQDVAPYVGGGLEWLTLNLKVPSDSFDGGGNGLGGYVDGGVEMLRTHHAHLAFGARLDLPFFSEASTRSNCATGTACVSTTDKIYYAPVSLEARLTF